MTRDGTTTSVASTTRLDELLGGVAAAPAATVPPKRPLPRPPDWRLILEGAVVAGLAALVARGAGASEPPNTASGNMGQPHEIHHQPDPEPEE